MILIKGATPIPFELVTIVSGLLGYNFWLFVALSVATRGRGSSWSRRPALVRRPLRTAMERNFAAVLGGFARSSSPAS